MSFEGFSSYLQQKLLDHIFTDAAYTPPATLYIGLASGTASDRDGTGLTEVSTSGTAYARQAVTASTFGAATGTNPSTKTSGTAVPFATATAAYASGANITRWVLYDASTAGNLLANGLLTTAKAVASGDTPTLSSGGIVLKLGQPADTF